MNKLVIDPNLVMARAAGQAWAARPIAERLAVLRATRRHIVGRAETLAATIARPAAETLATELLPLVAACRFLERRAPSLLRPRRLRLAPLWLFGVQHEIRREPHGAVLILAPANYPLFLPGVQALQALAAGNAVCVKPAPGKSAPMRLLAEMLGEAGLPDGVLQVLPEHAGAEAAAAGFDHIVLTGGAAAGAAVGRLAAERLTPTTMELSGVDPVFVLPGADLALVAALLAFGLRLNAGRTCIAPRRVFVAAADEAELLSRLLAQLPPPAPIAPAVADRLGALLDAAAAQGARIAARNPAVLSGGTPELALLREDVFAPWLCLVPVAGIEEALAAARQCDYALGASIFGPDVAARALARRVDAGSICINDLIVPTADPRLPFGGRRASGYGVTRGAEGLLAMTAVKTISRRTRNLRPHLDPKLANNPAALLTLLRLLYGGWPERRQAIRLRRPAARGSGSPSAPHPRSCCPAESAAETPPHTRQSYVPR